MAQRSQDLAIQSVLAVQLAVSANPKWDIEQSEDPEIIIHQIWHLIDRRSCGITVMPGPGPELSWSATVTWPQETQKLWNTSKEGGPKIQVKGILTGANKEFKVEEEFKSEEEKFYLDHESISWRKYLWILQMTLVHSSIFFFL